MLLVPRTVRANFCSRYASSFVVRLEPITPLAQPLRREIDSLFPAHRRQLAIRLAHQRLGQAVFAIRKVEGVAALDAEEVAVDAALVAVIAANDFHARIVAAQAQRGLAAVAAVGADGGDVVHLPWPRLVPIGTGGERADRADVDAHAALFALEVVRLVGRDHRTRAAILNAQRPYVHAFAAHPHAAVAE